MAKRKKTKTRKIYIKTKKKGRKKSSKLGQLSKFVGAGVYGAIRQNVSDRLAPLTAKIPGGNIADEVVMLGANWIIGKYAGRKFPMIRPVTNAGMIIESARIGQAIANGELNFGSGPATITGQSSQRLSFR